MDFWTIYLLVSVVMAAYANTYSLLKYTEKAGDSVVLNRIERHLTTIITLLVWPVARVIVFIWRGK